MTNVIGRLKNVGWGLEATSGTATTIDYWVPVLDKDFEDTAEFIMNDSSYGVKHKDNDQTIQRQHAEGSITGKVHLDSIGVPFSVLAASAPQTSVSTGEYTHVWEEGTSVNGRTATLVYKDTNEDIAFANATLSTFELNFQLDRYFEYTASFISKKSATATSTVSYTDETEFAPKYSVIKLASAQTGLDAAAAISVISANVQWNFNSEAKQVLGSTDISDVHTKATEITGTIEVYYDGDTYKDLAFDETQQAMRLSVVNTDVTLANSSNPYVELDLYKVKFAAPTRQMSQDDIVRETVEFRAYADIDNSLKAYTLTMLNGDDGTNYA